MTKNGNGADHRWVALRLGIAATLGVGALATGFLWSWAGRRVRDDRRLRGTDLERRVLERLRSDLLLAHRRLDAEEVEPGVVRVTGLVGSRWERDRALGIARAADRSALVLDGLGITLAAPRRTSTTVHLRPPAVAGSG